ncbi:hypothetical protein NGRA_2496 [Nosema granulosis]|uniref:Uncharacterized protein n=1 Tax=Nosema granulosis TaxID=83296 RepID=A0A9P6GXJ8_9MICR|nr:hypothetical protein NGRA_2496 [Nosema granulosis]
MIVVCAQHDCLEKILEEINFIRNNLGFVFEANRFKNDVFSVMYKENCHFISSRGCVELKSKMIFDNPVTSLRIQFDGYTIIKKEGFKESLYLSKTIASKGNVYRILLFESLEMLNLVQGYLKGRVSTISSSHINISYDNPERILEELVKSSIV